MALMNCPECGQTVSDKAKACPHCGYTLPTISTKVVCPECGNELLSDTKVCNNCGFEVSSEIVHEENVEEKLVTVNQHKGFWSVGRLVIGIISILLFFIITLQSCAAGVSNVMLDSSSLSGTAGLLVAIFMLVAGIVGICTRNSKSKVGIIIVVVLYWLSTLIALGNVGNFADLIIWGLLAFVFGGVFFACVFNTPNYGNDKNTAWIILGVCIVIGIGVGILNSSKITKDSHEQSSDDVVGMLNTESSKSVITTEVVTAKTKSTVNPMTTPKPTVKPTIRPTIKPTVKPKTKSKYLKGMKYYKNQIDPIELAGTYAGDYGNTYGTVNIYSSFEEGNIVGNVTLYIDSEVPKYGAVYYEGKLKKIAKNLYKVSNNIGDEVLLCVDYQYDIIVMELWINKEHIENYYMSEHYES